MMSRTDGEPVSGARGSRSADSTVRNVKQAGGIGRFGRRRAELLRASPEPIADTSMARVARSPGATW